mmetsp:Transcript_31487/g.66239  ORF Transcript_31487/g.66239 Transcript_31487/m.66239 type:complete len:209 (-) Transcript_31487:553-1179(-)
MSASSLSVAAFAAVGISPAMSYVGNRPDRLAFAGIGCRLVSIVVFGVIVSRVMSTFAVASAQDEDNTISNNGLMATTLASVFISLSSHMHATSLTTLTTGTVSAEERGAIIGLEHGLFSMARIVGPPLGTTLLSRGPSSVLGFMGDIGAAGLWRVVLVCMVMDVALMASLKVWSTRQYSKIERRADDDDDGKSHKPLLEEMNDHDHSD